MLTQSFITFEERNLRQTKPLRKRNLIQNKETKNTLEVLERKNRENREKGKTENTERGTTEEHSPVHRRIETAMLSEEQPTPSIRRMNRVHTCMYIIVS
jgi:hypothetical protein